jgi:hypothetical protein
MDLTEGSETSAKLNQPPGKYPKENIQVSEHGENLKSRIKKRPYAKPSRVSFCIAMIEHCMFCILIFDLQMTSAVSRNMWPPRLKNSCLQ